LIYVLHASVHTGGRRSNFVGLENYRRFLEDPFFWNALQNTTLFTLGSVALHVVLGVGAALLLARAIRGRTFFRIVGLVPWMLSSVVVATLWRWMYHPQFGVINDILSRLGFQDLSQTAWLGEINLALAAVIFTNAWRGFPFVMIMVLAGLQAIPREQYEAASVDGAAGLAVLRYVTFPNLRFILTISILLDTIWTFKYFDLMQVMTGGGPANSTEVLTTLVYRNAFEFLEVEYASAIAVFMFLILLAFTLVYARLALLGPEPRR
jgi:multiple sugar transport system permease protein